MAKNNFQLTLDTLAPQGSISRADAQQYLNNLEGQKVSIVKGDAVLMKVWFDTVAAGDTAKIPATFEAAATEKAIVLPGEGTYYAHLILRDEVANDSEIFSSDAIVYDTTAPVVTDFAMADLDYEGEDCKGIITNERTVKYTFTYMDALAGVTSARIYSDYGYIEEQVFNLVGNDKKTGTITIKDTAPDGDIVVNVAVTDRAGNTNEIGAGSTYTIKLDTQMEIPTLVVKGFANNAWTNAEEVVVALTSADEDIKAYKVWDGDVEPADWTDYTVGTKLNVETTFAVTTEGTHTFKAKVKDTANSEVAATEVSINIDQSAPVVTAEVDKDLISNVEGYNVVKLTTTNDSSISGFKSVAYYINGTEYKGDIAAIASTNFVEGANTITVKVTDIAGNVGEASVAVELDTVAPANIELDGALNTWYKDEKPFSVKVRAEDTNTITAMYAWTIGPDGNANTIPAGTTSVNVASNPQTIDANAINWGHAQSASNYLCVAVVDEVGNVGYIAPVVFGFDSVVPAGTVKFEKTVYGSTSANVVITYEDATSGVAQMKLDGDIVATDWENVANSRSIELTEGDAIKSIKIKFRDVAGNESEWIDGTNTTELDMSKPSAAISLYKEDGTTVKPQVSAEAKTVVKITYTDTDGRGAVEYKLYGDFVESSDEWVAFSADKGTDSKSITVTAIAPVGTEKVARTFNVVVRDNAGNESPVASASFYLDPSQPEVEVEDLDHNRISKVHDYRNCIVEAHTKSDSYADEVKFYIAPSEIITEYKVCAYKTADDALAVKDPEAEVAIPVTAGSVHMAGTTSSAERIDCMIKGADYEAALGGEGNDGAHIVVVYVKNEAGLWSANMTQI